MQRTARLAITDAEPTEFGWRRDYGPEAPRPLDYEKLTAPDLAPGPAAPADADDLDPTLRSADIEAGIARGLRIHAALAQLTAGRTTLSLDHLAPEERAAIERFLSRPQGARDPLSPRQGPDGAAPLRHPLLRHRGPPHPRPGPHHPHRLQDRPRRPFGREISGTDGAATGPFFRGFSRGDRWKAICCLWMNPNRIVTV